MRILALLLVAGCITSGKPTDDTGSGPGDTDADADGDGFAASVDCDDGDADIHPDATEVCDGLDNDCDGLADDEDDSLDTGTAEAWYPDDDEDGYGEDTTAVLACAQPGTGGGISYIQDNRDCDDSDLDVHPDATEICDALDNDCDGLTDDEDDSLDTTTAASWAPDADGDGYGDAATVVLACDDPSASGLVYLSDASDCDDADADIHPGATEACDGLDNDCDASTTDAGGVSLYDADADTWTDLTDVFAVGTASTPAALVFKKTGALVFCDGTYYANLIISAEMTISSENGAEATVIDGGGVDTVLSIEGSGLTVSIAGLTLTNGDGQGEVLGGTSYPAGGGLYCKGNSEISVTDCRITGNRAYVGGGVHIEYCDATFEGVEISDNQADYHSGGMSVLGGIVTLADSEVRGNSSGTYAGGLGLGSYNTTTELTLSDSLVTENDALYGGGGFGELDSALVCTGTDAITAGVLNNTATTGGGWWLPGSGETLSSDVCDWGTAEAGDDNSPEDVYGDDAYSYGADATFSCASTACSP